MHNLWSLLKQNIVKMDIMHEKCYWGYLFWIDESMLNIVTENLVGPRKAFTIAISVNQHLIQHLISLKYNMSLLSRPCMMIYTNLNNGKRKKYGNETNYIALIS